MRSMIRFALLPIGLALPAGAQSHPSFVGEWARVVAAPDAPAAAATPYDAFPVGDMGSGWGSALSIMQTSDSLVVTFVHFSAYDIQPRLRYAFALNGAESVNHVTIGHSEATPRARVRWDGATLVITSRYATPPEVGPESTEVQQALSLDASGRLVVETTRPGARGPNVVRTTYARH